MPLIQPAISDNVTLDILSSSLPSQEPVVKTWHHDCSNTSGFVYTEIPTNNPMNYWHVWTHLAGDLQSEAQGLHVTNILSTPVDTLYSGPMYVYDLPTSFPLSGLRNFSVQIALNNTNPEYQGSLEVGLFDESYSPILMEKCIDSYSDEAAGFCMSKYYLRNISLHNRILHNEEYNEYDLVSIGWLKFVNMTWCIWYEAGQGVSGSVPAYGPFSESNGTFVPETIAESAREVKYLVLIFGRYGRDGTQPFPPFSIRDIFLEYEVGGLIDNVPPTIDPAPDMIWYNNQTNLTIEWNSHDDHPTKYWVVVFPFSLYTSVILEHGLWNGSGFNVTIRLGPTLLSPGYNHSVALIVQDQGGLIALDKINVTTALNPIEEMWNTITPYIQYALILGVFSALYYVVFFRRAWNPKTVSVSSPTQLTPT